jgi:hypothetical protein
VNRAKFSFNKAQHAFYWFYTVIISYVNLFNLLELNERPNNVEIFVHGLSHQLGQDLGQGPSD